MHKGDLLITRYTGKRSKVSLLLHSCTDFGERATASSKSVLPLCAKQGYVGMGFQTAGSSQWSCKELGEESGLLPSYSCLTKGKREKE